MNILVTGGAGFIASAIARDYLKNGHQVIIIDDLSTGKKSNLPEGAVFLELDVRSSTLMEVFQEYHIEFVNHHAARSDVREAVANPKIYVNMNIEGGVNLLECCRKTGVKGFIFASSGGCAYGEAEVIPTDESEPLDPADPYGVSKISFEFYLKTYHRLCHLPYVIFRYSNIYGPHQNPFGETGVVSIIAKQMQQNKEVVIYGDGNQVRDFLFVEDVVSANRIALQKMTNKIYNLGSGRGYSVNDLFHSLKGLIDYKKAPIYQPRRMGEISRSVLNSELIKKDWGWSPEISFEEGLRLTLDYLKSEL